MGNRINKYIIASIVTTLILVGVYCCTGIKTPAPLGVHGEYSSISYNPNYQASMSKDSFLLMLSKENVEIKSGRLNNYDPPWDSLRYVLGNIICDNQEIEAYIEFKDKKATNRTFKVFWFNAAPTKDDKIYEKLTANYYNCFEALLKKNNLIK
jgi:hypothetical protein